MLLQRALPSWLKSFRTLYFAALLARVFTVDAYVYCSRESFGAPRYTDCTGTLSAVPTDAVTHFFVEQQLRTTLPGANWYPFVDPRPVGLRKEVVQVPKWWSQGTCNIALLSYVHEGMGVSVSAMEWSKVFAAGLQTLMICLASNNQGGAATVNDNLGVPRLSIFVWQDGAAFDRTMNGYMQAPFPVGIDPSNPGLLQSNVLPSGNHTTTGIMLAGNISTS